jgi:phosphatidylglycerophosphate synthase
MHLDEITRFLHIGFHFLVIALSILIGLKASNVIKDQITIHQVRKSMSQHIRTLFVMRYIARPVANLITPYFYNSGWSANQVTTFRGVVAAIAVGALLIDSYWAAVGAVVGYYVVYLLDCVDGNLARLRNTATYWGKFADGLVDLIFRAAAPLLIAHSYFQSGGELMIAIIGIFSTVSLFANQFIRARFSFMREWMIRETGAIAPEVNASLAGLKRWTGLTTAWYSNAFFFVPLILLIPDFGYQLFLLAMIFVQLIPDALWLMSSLSEAHKILRRSRRSIHAPTSAEMAECSNDAARLAEAPTSTS